MNQNNMNNQGPNKGPVVVGTPAANNSAPKREIKTTFGVSKIEEEGRGKIEAPKVRKNPIIPLLIIAILIFGSYYVFVTYVLDDTVFKDTEKINTLKSGLLGVWKMNYKTATDAYDNYNVYDITLTFKDDGTCIVKGTLNKVHRYKTETVAINSTGKYVFNNAGTKIKIKYDKPNEENMEYMHADYAVTEIVNGELHIGEEFVYRKVA